MTRVAGPHYLDHVRRPPVGRPERAGLRHLERHPVPLVGTLLRKSGGRDSLSPPGRDQRGTGSKDFVSEQDDL